MFGYVTASWKELTQQQKDRYSGVYCGICREIGTRSSQTARLALSYDMAFLALLLMSLYEPQDHQGKNRCLMHPGRGRIWIDNEFVRYAADMNVAWPTIIAWTTGRMTADAVPSSWRVPWKTIGRPSASDTPASAMPLKPASIG